MKQFTSKFSDLVNDVQNRVAQNPKLNSAATSAANTSSFAFNSAVNFAKGVTQGHSSLKATFAHITNAPIPRYGHSISVVKGRAYIFGGYEEEGVLAENDIQLVILPSSGVLDADFTNIPARPKTLREGAALDASTGVPESRSGHTTVIVGDDIYMFGGEDEKGQAVDREHPGRVWVFDTSLRAWSALDPSSPDAPAPQPRALHGAASSEYPGPHVKHNAQEPLPQQPRDPAKTVPEVPEKDSWGTLVVTGGRASSAFLNDAWAFDIRTRVWSALPTPPAPARISASVAIADNKLFRFGGFDGTQHLGGGIDTLDLTSHWKHDSTVTVKPISPHSGAWHSQPYINGLGPRERAAAGLVNITTGQGRHYLLLLGGSVSTTPSSAPAFFDDVWTYQLPSSPNTAADIKDATYSKVAARFRSASQSAKGQPPSSPSAAPQDPNDHGVWAEVHYQYLDSEGNARPTAAEQRGKGIGSRGDFAVAQGTEVDGASVVVWGGSVDGGKTVLADGWMITVERQGVSRLGR